MGCVSATEEKQGRLAEGQAVDKKKEPAAGTEPHR